MAQRRWMLIVPLMVCVTVDVHAWEQRRGTESAGRAVPAASGSTDSSSAAAANVEQIDFMLRRDALDARTRQTSPSTASSNGSRSRFSGLTGALKGAVTGDAQREAAAKELLEELAVAASARGSKAVIVIIGSDADRAKARETLPALERRVVLGLLDTNLKDDLHDNGAIGSGMMDKVAGNAANVWVFLPRPAAGRRNPEHVLSSRALNERVWSGIFTADGDAAGLKSLTTRQSSPASAPASTPAPAGSGMAVGDVVVPKIAGVKVLAQPSDTAKVAATLTKTDELVVTDAGRDGFVGVQGATASGWVKVALIMKQ